MIAASRSCKDEWSSHPSFHTAKTHISEGRQRLDALRDSICAEPIEDHVKETRITLLAQDAHSMLRNQTRELSLWVDEADDWPRPLKQEDLEELQMTDVRDLDAGEALPPIPKPDETLHEMGALLRYQDRQLPGGFILTAVHDSPAPKLEEDIFLWICARDIPDAIRQHNNLLFLAQFEGKSYLETHLHQRAYNSLCLANHHINTLDYSAASLACDIAWVLITNFYLRVYVKSAFVAQLHLLLHDSPDFLLACTRRSLWRPYFDCDLGCTPSQLHFKALPPPRRPTRIGKYQQIFNELERLWNAYRIVHGRH